METELLISKGIAASQSVLQRTELADEGREANFPFHTLNFWGDVNRPNSPYSFGLNVDTYGALLTDLLMLSPQEMKRADIHIVGEGRFAREGSLPLSRLERENILPGGKKRVVGREIVVGYTGLYDDESVPPSPWDKRPIYASIYLFTFWHFFVTERKMILKYVKKRTEKIRQKLLGKHMRVFSVTDEMLDFLASDPELADERMRKLAGIKLREEVLIATAHEAASHIFDATRNSTVDGEQEMRKKLIARVTRTTYTPPNFMEQFLQHPVVKRFLPDVSRSRPKPLVFEDLARAIEKAAIADPRYKNLVEFEINANWPFQNGKLKPVDDHEVGDVLGEASGLDSSAESLEKVETVVFP